MTLNNANNDPLPPRPPQEQQTENKDLEQDVKETTELVQNGIKQLRESRDAGSGLAAFALIVAALFAFRRQRTEQNTKLDPVHEGVRLEAMTQENPESALKETDDRIAERTTEQTTLQTEIKSLEQRISTPPSELTDQQRKDLVAQLNAQLNTARQQLVKVSGEIAALNRLRAQLVLEQQRRAKIMGSLQGALTAGSRASAVTLSGNALNITFRQDVTDADRKQVEAAAKRLRIETPSFSGRTVTMAVPPQFWSPSRTNEIAAAGFDARAGIFAWLAGSNEPEAKQNNAPPQEVKKNEADRQQTDKKETTAKNQTEKEKTDAAQKQLDDERNRKEASNIILAPAGQLLTQYLANRNAMPVSGSATEAVYRVVHAVENAPSTSLLIRVKADPRTAGRFVIEWTDKMAPAATDWQSATAFGSEANRKLYPNLQSLMNDLQGLQAGNVNALLGRERLRTQKREAGLRYLTGAGGTMEGNSRGETVIAYRQRAGYAAIYFHFTDGQWMWAETAEARGNLLKPLNECTVDIALGLAELNADGEALQKILPQNALRTQRQRIGEAKLRELGAVPHPTRLDILQFTSGSRTVSFTYLNANNLGWVWTDHADPVVPTEENMKRYGSAQCWMRLTRTYSASNGTALTADKLACNAVATALHAINTGTAQALQSADMINILDRDTRFRGGVALLSNHSGVEVQPGIVRVERGPLSAFFFRGPEANGRRPWLWAATLANAQAGTGVALTAAYPGEADEDSAALLKQLTAIAAELQAFNTGSPMDAANLALRQRALNDTINARRRADLNAAKALVYAMRRSGVNLQVPISNDDAPPTRLHNDTYPTWVGDYWVQGPDGRQQRRIDASTANLKEPAQAMELALMTILVLETPPANSPLGLYVKESTGEIFPVPAGPRIWPRAGDTRSWIAIARSSPMEAVQIIASLPMPPVTEAFRTNMQNAVRIFCGGRLAMPQFTVALPPSVRQSQLREQILQSAIGVERIKTENVLTHAYARAVQRAHNNLYLERERSMFGVIASRVITDWGNYQDREYEITTQTANLCQRNYRRLHYEYPSTAPLMQQLEFLMRLRVEVDTRHRDQELRDMCTNVMRQADRFTAVARPVGAVGEAILSLTALDKVVSTMSLTAGVIGGNDPVEAGRDYALGYIPGYSIYAAIDPVMSAPENIKKAFAADNAPMPIIRLTEEEEKEIQSDTLAKEMEERQKKLGSI